MLRALFMCFLLSSAAVAQEKWGMRPDGNPVTQLGRPDSKAVVLFFVASDCPISNRTFPEMQRLRERFVSAGVSFWYVYPNEGEKPAEIAAHQASFDAKGAALISTGPDLVRLAHAVATPEMAVLRPNGNGWKPVYTGRIDDRFLSLGQERTQVTEYYGEKAVEAVLAGRNPPAPVGRPVGCAIMNPGVNSR